jgi:site-specific recombinase XerD
MAIGTVIMDKNKSKSNISLIINQNAVNGISAYRLVSANGLGIDETNEYLDMLATRGLSLRTLRAYAYDLLNFFRWLISEDIHLSDITKSLLLKYIRYQHEYFPGENKIAPSTINHRLTVVRSLYRYHFNQDIPSGRHTVKQKSSFFLQHSKFVPCLPRKFPSSRRALRVKMPKKIIKPLTREEVSGFLDSLKSWRDIAITAFMLLCGLRSREVISLTLDNIRISEDQVRIWGKGEKERIVPLPKDLVTAIKKYIQLERPRESKDRLFVVLKGPNRGQPITPAGLRSIYRYHRKISGSTTANPHRFRHTFGANMAIAGIPLPVLMRLMGHASIETTIGYANISLNDIRKEFHRVLDSLYTKEIKNGPKEEN